MTLRYEGNKPVGLDWTVCNDGNPRPELWGTLPAKTAPSRPRAVRSPEQMANIRNRITAETEREVIRLYTEQIEAAPAIAAELGIASASVYKILRRNNIPTRTKAEGMKLSVARRSS